MTSSSAASSDGDLDLTTDATPPDVKAIVGPWADTVWTQGERFGTIGCAKDGREFEITTHRAEAYQPDSRKPEVEFSTDDRGRPVRVGTSPSTRWRSR